ncbi:Transposable element Tcb2 transposase [Portunus trituberculatus]|uniref:Transposable element Tcb2 transposase n=1 Tax=Portunus trituberculatus TaxID=210409 RepID=A0A5B7J515_PORTR|nr:Transposable element Tcb2 transposase [Portunus trituberculatus]
MFVCKWVAIFKKEGGCDTPGYKPRKKYPKKTSYRATNVIKRQLEHNPRVTARKIKESNPGLFEERCHRVKVCKKYLQWDADKCLDVLWTDESTFTLTGNRGGNMYQRAGSNPLDVRQTVKYPDSLMVWGSFRGRGLGSLVVLPKNVKVNQYVYYELLNDHLEDSFNSSGANIFQHDHGPAHTARSVTQWLKDCHIPYIADWSGNSPVINAIENLWNHIKRDLQGKDTSSVPKLEAAICQSWASITPTQLAKYATSILNHLREIIAH